MSRRCYLFGVRGNDVRWLAQGIRALQREVVDVPNCRLVSVHYDSHALSETSLTVDGIRLGPQDVVLFFGVPKVSQRIGNATSEQALCEWRAALETVLLSGHAGAVPNGEWLLRNCSLRSSDAYWTLACQQICASFGDPREGDAPPHAGIQVVLTRRGAVTIPPNIFEIEAGSLSQSLGEIQERMHDARLDFLRLSVDVRENGRATLMTASAELPRHTSPAFEAALADIV